MGMDERKLTASEERRKQVFEQLRLKMTEQNYRVVELKMDAAKVNKQAVLYALPFLLAVLVPYIILHGNPMKQDFSVILFLVASLIGIVIHELIHGLTWVISSKGGWSSIEFGVVWKQMMPYCTCSKPMKKAPMMVAVIMPTIVLGLLPAVLAIVWGHALLLLFGVMMILGGGGDILILSILLKYRTESTEVLFMDHPYEIGTIVFER